MPRYEYHKIAELSNNLEKAGIARGIIAQIVEGGEAIRKKATSQEKFFGRHWGIVTIFVVAIISAFVGAVYVFLWFTGSAQSTGLVPAAIGFWTMGNMVAFILHLIFWELLLIGIPVAIGAVAGWQWWKRLPDEEKREYHVKRSRTIRGESGISALFFIAFCIKVFIDGNWNVPIATWTLDYVVGSMIFILFWGAVIFGIPIAVGIIWWISHKMKKS